MAICLFFHAAVGVAMYEYAGGDPAEPASDHTPDELPASTKPMLVAAGVVFIFVLLLLVRTCLLTWSGAAPPPWVC